MSLQFSKVMLRLKQGQWQEKVVVFFQWETAMISHAPAGRELVGGWEFAPFSSGLRGLVADSKGGAVSVEWFTTENRDFSLMFYNEGTIGPRGTTPAFILNAPGYGRPPYKFGSIGQVNILRSANQRMWHTAHEYEWLDSWMVRN